MQKSINLLKVPKNIEQNSQKHMSRVTTYWDRQNNQSGGKVTNRKYGVMQQ